jgi:hypothetical protein
MKIDQDGWATIEHAGEVIPSALHNARNALAGAPPMMSRREIQQEAQGLEFTLRALIKQHGVQAFMRTLGDALSER